jgi:hypothetical protein
LYTLARFSDAWVVDNLSVVDGVAYWNVVFTRYAQDWEVEMVLSFYEQLYSTRIRHEVLEYMENILYFPYIPYLVDIVIFSIYGEL